MERLGKVSTSSTVGPIVLAVAAIAVIAFTAYELANWPPEPPPASTSTAHGDGSAADDSPATPAPSPDEGSSGEGAVSTGSTSDQGPTSVAVLGDSFTAKSPASSGAEWPSLLGESLGWKVTSSAVDDSGYLNAGQGLKFGARVPAVLHRSPDVVVVAGGFADLGGYPIPQVSRAADDLVEQVGKQAPDAKVVLVSPFSNGAPSVFTRRLSSDLQQVAEERDAAYVDATRWLATGGDLMSPDGVHPTQLGQQQLAVRMEQALRQLGLVDAPS